MGAYEDKIAKRLEEHEKKLADRQAAHEAKLEARVKAQEDQSASKTSSEEQAQLYGGSFDTNQRTVIDALIRLVRTQNPCVGFFYAGGQTPITTGTLLNTQYGLMNATMPTGIISMWSGLLVNIPAGFKLCDGTAGTPDLRSKFIKGAAAGVDPGVTGGSNTHSHTVTPTGSNSAPAFTGSALGTHNHTETGTTSSDSAGTPAGSVAAPIFTGTAMANHDHGFTPAGTNAGGAVDAHAGTAVGNHIFTQPSTHGLNIRGSGAGIDAVGAAGAVHSGGGVDAHSVTQPSAHTFTQPTFTGSAGTTAPKSAGTPAGTNSAPAFTGSALGNHSHTTSGTTSSNSAGTPSGSVAAPTFTGNLNTTSTSSNEPVYYSLAFIMQDISGFTGVVDLGWVPIHNGFFAGYSYISSEQFVAAQGLRFRIYRDEVASTCTFIVTNTDNKTNPSGNAGGAIKARLFNTIPYERDPTDNTQRYVYPFKAGEKITIATETMAMPNFTDSGDVCNLIVWLYYVFSVPTDETLNAQNYGGGSPGDIPGGGGGGGGNTGGEENIGW